VVQRGGGVLCREDPSAQAEVRSVGLFETGMIASLEQLTAGDSLVMEPASIFRIPYSTPLRVNSLAKWQAAKWAGATSSQTGSCSLHTPRA